MPASTPSDERLWPPSAGLLKLLFAAFAAGFLLFLLVWWKERKPHDFYRAGAAAPAATVTPPEALPAPQPVTLADVQSISGLTITPNASVETTPEPVTPEPPAAPEPADASAPTTSGDPAPVVPPTPLSAPPPPYPPEALRMQAGGTVQVRVTVTATGQVDHVELRQSSGNPILDRAALDSVRHWTFQPAQQNGQPVAADVDVPIQFTPTR